MLKKCVFNNLTKTKKLEYSWKIVAVTRPSTNQGQCCLTFLINCPCPYPLDQLIYVKYWWRKLNHNKILLLHTIFLQKRVENTIFEDVKRKFD